MGVGIGCTRILEYDKLLVTFKLPKIPSLQWRKYFKVFYGNVDNWGWSLIIESWEKSGRPNLTRGGVLLPPLFAADNPFFFMILRNFLIFFLEKRRNRLKTRSFAWKIKNRPTCCDFEKIILDLQLLKILKPIRILLCNDSFCIHIQLYLRYILFFYLGGVPLFVL